MTRLTVVIIGIISIAAIALMSIPFAKASSCSSSRGSSGAGQAHHCLCHPSPEPRDRKLRLAGDSRPRTPSEDAPASPRFDTDTVKPYRLVG